MELLENEGANVQREPASGLRPPTVRPDPGGRDESRPAVQPVSTQERILQAVAESRGIGVSTLREEIGVGWGTLYDRLEALEARGAVEVASNDARKVVYPADGALAEADQPVAALSRLESETSREIADVVLDGGVEDVESLAEATGHSRRVCYYHVRRLIEAGLVSVRRRTQLVNLEATALLERLQP